MRVLRKVLALLLMVAVLGGLPTGCSGQKTPDTYRVGVIASQTGPYSALGLPAIDGARLVADQINAAGGIHGKQLELLYYDDKGSSTETALAAQKAIEVDQVVAVACISATGLSHSMIAVVNDNEIPGLIMSGTGLVDKTLGAWAFKPTSSEKDYIPLPLGYLTDDLGLATCAGLIENSGYGEGGEFYLKEIAPGAGVDFVTYQHFDPGATDMTPQLANIKASGAQSIFIWGSGPAGALAVKQAREMGIMVPIVTTPAQNSPAYYESFRTYYEMEPSLVCTVRNSRCGPSCPTLIRTNRCVGSSLRTSWRGTIARRVCGTRSAHNSSCSSPTASSARIPASEIPSRRGGRSATRSKRRLI